MKNRTKMAMAAMALCILGMAACGGKDTQNQKEAKTEREVAAGDTKSGMIDKETVEEIERGIDEDSAGKEEKTDTVAKKKYVDPVLDDRKAPNTYNFRPGRAVEGKLIALTFDDGPSKQTLKILETLKKYDAYATFFVVGNAINAKTSEYMRAAVEQGSEICSHTWNHPYLSLYDYDQVQETITKTNEAIKDAVGYYPNFYRPPYLDADRYVLNYAGMPAVSGYSTDDWVTTHTPEQITETVLKHARPNRVYIMHDLGANSRTPAALDSIIPALQAQGYSLVTVSDLFTSAGVTPDPYTLYVSPTSSPTPNSQTTYRERRKRK